MENGHRNSELSHEKYGISHSYVSENQRVSIDEWNSIRDQSITHRIHVWYIYANIWDILMVNVTIYKIHRSYGLVNQWTYHSWVSLWLTGHGVQFQLSYWKIPWLLSLEFLVGALEQGISWSQLTNSIIFQRVGIPPTMFHYWLIPSPNHIFFTLPKRNDLFFLGNSRCFGDAVLGCFIWTGDGTIVHILVALCDPRMACQGTPLGTRCVQINPLKHRFICSSLILKSIKFVFPNWSSFSKWTVNKTLVDQL